MKLSEAIRLGIGAVRNDPRVFLSRVNPDTHKPELCGCAIGTALYAVGQTESNGYVASGIESCERVWPWTARPVSPGKASIAVEISRRHTCGESRESVADWIATIEPQEEEVTHAGLPTQHAAAMDPAAAAVIR